MMNQKLDIKINPVQTVKNERKTYYIMQLRFTYLLIKKYYYYYYYIRQLIYI